MGKSAWMIRGILLGAAVWVLLTAGGAPLLGAAEPADVQAEYER